MPLRCHALAASVSRQRVVGASGHNDGVTTMTSRATVIDSPIGPLILSCDGDELTGLYVHDNRHAPTPDGHGEPPCGVLADTAAQLAAYFRGELTTFDVPLAPRGTPFQQRVWAALQEIPYGETTSYGSLAAEIGQPTASRAVGLANGRNPISIIVPCHRVVGSSGKLVGYGGGLERKQALLALEQRGTSLF
jgi:methylated-DNA-[protein]-cysteine S-methyltransferase